MTREANNNSRVRAYDAKHSMFLFLSELHFHSISGSTSTDPTQQDKSSGNEDMRVGRRAGKARQCKAANLGLDAEELAAAGDGPERENHRRRGFQESWRGGSRRRGRHWGAATHEEEAVDKRDGRAAREQGGAGQSTLVREDSADGSFTNTQYLSEQDFATMRLLPTRTVLWWICWCCIIGLSSTNSISGTLFSSLNSEFQIYLPQYVLRAK
jgi:hypothetical protein